MFAGQRGIAGRVGLGVFEGECERFPAEVKSPHVGWNQIEDCASSRLLWGVPSSVVCLFHAFVSRATEQIRRSRAASMAADSRRRWSGIICLECSFIRKNPGRLG